MKKMFYALIFLVSATFPVLAADSDDGFYTRADIGYVYGTENGVKKDMRRKPDSDRNGAVSCAANLRSNIRASD